MRYLVCLLGFAAALAVGCGSTSQGRDQAGGGTEGPTFEEVAAAAGVAHVHEKPLLDPVLGNIMPWMTSVGAAVAAGDYDNDGFIDLYVTSSRKGSPNRLFRNLGDGSFEDVAAAAGVADVNDDGGTSMDSVWADIDNDGFVDLYVVRWGRDRLFGNNGDGTFSERTAQLFRTADGLPGTPWANGNAVIAWDYDRDGLLDLYVGNYFADRDLWDLDTTLIMHDDFEVARNAGRNFLYHQQPDGTFEEVAGRLAVDDTGWTLAVGAADLDNDGWPDLYSANDFGPDRLFVNNADGTFVNATEAAIGSDTKKGMNVDFGDFNNDGWIDIYVTNITTARYLQEGNMLWRNNGLNRQGVVHFMDISAESSTFDGGWGWGAKFLDYDNDGDQDLFAVNGFVSAGEGSYWYDLASWTVLDRDPADSRNWPEMGDRSFSGYETFRFWHNEGHESFKEISSSVGLDSDRDGRGVACLDYDNDGDVDIFVANQGQGAQLFRNSGRPGHHWLTVRLETDPTTPVNRDAIGTRVTLVTGEHRQVRERDGGTGYSGQSDPRLHFGLGGAQRVDLIEVRWPDGGLQYMERVEVDRLLTIRQSPAEYVDATRVAFDQPQRRAGVEPVKSLVPQMAPEEFERLASRMEQQLRQAPLDHRLAHDYRRRCVDQGEWDRSIEFFSGLVEEDPDNLDARLELSVAYVDKIPSRGGIAAIVSKGTLARRSLDQLDYILERRPDWWLAVYSRGMNHLHWPRALRHSADAVADFRHCLALQQADAQGSQDAPSYYERTWVLLGDALAKQESYDQAQQVWREGLERYGDSQALAARVDLAGDADREAFIKRQRSLEHPLDTDLSFVDGDR